MELIGQRFRDIRVLSLVGEGGMGSVYAAHHETLDRKVALKVLHFESSLDDEAQRRMLREARALSKLDHPNACRIYDYVSENGQNLLVLEYIEGETLEAIRGRLSRAEKLRIAMSIASVLVAAHRAGIIHRDLKPENVMVTKTGDVKVLDFGLARLIDMHTPGSPATEPVDEVSPLERSRASSSAGSSKRSYLLTAAGITMGTPLYMSPEQARGETLTPASDMYSFGLVLQTLFTGAEPHPENLPARMVMMRAATNQTEPVRGIDHAVTALIEQLKQAAPTDRLTAAAALARLQWIVDRPKRIGRRAAAAALIAVLGTGAWKYTVDLAEERTIAVEARKEAERRRGQAEDLIDFMMGDLHRSLQPLGQLQILDKAAERAMAYMSSQQPALMSADELAHNAVALQNLGQVRIDQGKLPDAMQAFQQSLRLAHTAVAKEPQNLGARFTLGQAQFWVGDAHRLLGNRTAAMANMRDYLATSEQLARAAPSNPDYQIELAYGYSNLGSMLEATGDYAGALSNYEKCVAIKQARLRTDPTNRKWQGDLAITIDKVAVALQKLGRLADARRHFAQEQNIYLQLTTAQPEHAPWRNRLVTNRWYIAGLLIDLGEIDPACEELLAARTDAEGLVTLDGANVQWRANLALVEALLGNAERMRGRLEASRAALESARARQRSVVRDAPEREAWRNDLTTMDLWFAQTLHESGDPAAEALAESALDRSRRAGQREQTADALVLLGRIASRHGRTADAAEKFRLAAEMFHDDRTLRAADRRARALLLAGRTTEAQPILARLREAQYAHRDLIAVIHTTEHDTATKGAHS